MTTTSFNKNFVISSEEAFDKIMKNYENPEKIFIRDRNIKKEYELTIALLNQIFPISEKRNKV